MGSLGDPEKLLPENDRSRCVSGSLLVRGRTDAIAPRSEGVFCFARGVFVYLTKPQLRRLLQIAASAFPEWDLAFDLQLGMSVFFGNFALRRAGMGSARLRLGAKCKATPQAAQGPATRSRVRVVREA